MTLLRLSIGVVAMLGLAESAQAQVPFFNGRVTAFTPEISIVSTGVVSDVQAAVSADRKYVTLNMRPQQSTLLALRDFTFQNGVGLGNVGDPPHANPPGKKTTTDDASSAVRSSPEEILAYAKSQASVLHQPGMSRISLLKD